MRKLKTNGSTLTFSGASKTHSYAQQGIVSLLSLPFRIGRRYGLFPLAFVPETLELHFCWKCLLTTIPYLLMIASTSLFGTLTQHELKEIYGVTGNTERLTNIVVNFFTQVFDTVCILRILFFRKRIQSFFSRFISKVVSLLEVASSENFYINEIRKRKHRLNRLIIFIGILAIISFGNSFTYYCVRVIYAKIPNWKLFIIGILSLYWVAINQLRMITFHLWISMVLCFKIGFTSLRVVTDPNFESRVFLNKRKLLWAMKNYMELETFLAEFHQLFSLQFLNICFTCLMTAINSWFHLTKFVATEFDIADVSVMITLACNLISIFITLGILCNVCSVMTNEVI